MYFLKISNLRCLEFLCSYWWNCYCEKPGFSPRFSVNWLNFFKHRMGAAKKNRGTESSRNRIFVPPKNSSRSTGPLILLRVCWGFFCATSFRFLSSPWGSSLRRGGVANKIVSFPFAHTPRLWLWDVTCAFVMVLSSRWVWFFSLSVGCRFSLIFFDFFLVFFGLSILFLMTSSVVFKSTFSKSTRFYLFTLILL